MLLLLFFEYSFCSPFSSSIHSGWLHLQRLLASKKAAPAAAAKKDIVMTVDTWTSSLSFLFFLVAPSFSFFDRTRNQFLFFLAWKRALVETRGPGIGGLGCEPRFHNSTALSEGYKANTLSGLPNTYLFLHHPLDLCHLKARSPMINANWAFVGHL